ncbi:HdaA/DnaA family protein [Sphingomonas profundi]|uniref:HdaA/DnaA family protein n=1 Tax=Alterirhizorhabdus profundi TaxID=2681549 RepID=UPI0012E8DA30|nr:chromosomal replication initiator DnaA [Sphingomonas profundi]
MALPLVWPEAERDGDFILSPASAAAVRHLAHWALWPVAATVLTGPRKSGRSLLGRIFAAKNRAMLIDDAERHAEEAIFHAWNRAQAERRPLLIIADAPPPAWPIALPDLASRLAATPRIALGDPDDALAAALIEKLLGARGLATGREVIAYLLPRTGRSHVAIHRLVDALDEVALARRQRITVPLARRALALLGVIDDSSTKD